MESFFGRYLTGALFTTFCFEWLVPLCRPHARPVPGLLQLSRRWIARVSVKRDYGGVEDALGIESRLAQVFMNLIVNAAQALEETSPREIVVSTRRLNDKVIIGVRDFGPGISEEVRARLFSPFFTTKPSGQGTGLGLYVSQTIVTGLRGELRVSNAAPGALFEVLLHAT